MCYSITRRPQLTYTVPTLSQDIYAAHFHGDAQYNDFPNIEFIHDLRKKDKYIYANLTFEKLRCSIVNKSN